MARATKKPFLVFCAATCPFVVIWLQRKYNFHARASEIAITTVAFAAGIYFGWITRQQGDALVRQQKKLSDELFRASKEYYGAETASGQAMEKFGEDSDEYKAARLGHGIRRLVANSPTRGLGGRHPRPAAASSRRIGCRGRCDHPDRPPVDPDRYSRHIGIRKSA